MKGVLRVRCPVCGKEGVWKDSPFRPFCSERCRLIDLGEWISGGYRISTPQDDESETDPFSGEDDMGK
jgi:endogenous inhibitor of DNA gyrase (YacG/DUF329 family)